MFSLTKISKFVKNFKKVHLLNLKKIKPIENVPIQLYVVWIKSFSNFYLSFANERAPILRIDYDCFDARPMQINSKLYHYRQ